MRFSDLQHTFRCVDRSSLQKPHSSRAQSGDDARSQSFRRTGTTLLCSFLLPIFAAGLARAQVIRDAASFHDQSAPSSTNSASISTKAGGELILAFVATDSLGSPNAVVKSLSGGGLTWTLVVRSNAQAGTSEIWRAFATKPVSANITASLSQSVVSSITLASYEGAATSGVNGAGAIGAIAASSSSQGAPTSTLIPLSSESLIVGVGNDFDSAIARTPVSGQSLLHQDLSSSGDTYWVQELNANSTIKGTKITMQDSAPSWDRYNFAICEIRPASAATALMTLSSTSLNFGNVAAGNSDAASLTLTSSGSAPLVINADAIAGTGFTLGNVTLPKTLTPGQTLMLPVSFSPKAVGASSGTLTIKSNSSASANGSTSVSLMGSGVSVSHSVSLSWLAPVTKTDPVVGYYIYRSAAGSTPVALNYALNTATSYVDGTAEGGATYTYDVKSVDAEGVQSLSSNTFTVAVPTT